MILADVERLRLGSQLTRFEIIEEVLMWSWSIQASGAQQDVSAAVAAAKHPVTIQMPDHDEPVPFPAEDAAQFELGRQDAIAKIAAVSAGSRIDVGVSGNGTTYSCSVIAGDPPPVDLARMHPADLAALADMLIAAQKGA